LKRWAEEQAEIVPQLWPSPERQSACAQYIRLCGGSTKGLPIAIYRGTWVSEDDIRGMASLPDEAVIVDHLTIEYDLKQLPSYTLDDAVFVTRASGIPGLLSARRWGLGDEDRWPRGVATAFIESSAGSSVTLAGAVVEALCVAWNVPIEEVLATNPLDREKEVRIGMVGDREIRDQAIRVVRPKPRNPSN
jgi:hypothetical protein